MNGVDELKSDPRLQKGFAIGMIQPQAIELEESVLGAMMLEKDAVDEVLSVLQAESFYKAEHTKIFETILTLYNRSEPVDILTVTQELKKSGDLEFIGGAFYISKLTNRVASAANVEFHARIVAQKFIARELIRVGGDMQSKAFDETNDVFELLQEVEGEIFQTVSSGFSKGYRNIAELVYERIQRLGVLAKRKDGLSGVPTGLINLDRITKGLQNSDMLILAARPGMGKTALMLTLARNAAIDFNHGVAIFSLEMSEGQLTDRLIVSETGIDSERYKTGNLEHYEWEKIHSMTTKLSEAPIYIDDTAALSVLELRSKARKLKSSKDIKMIVVDYLQLMTAPSTGIKLREQEISYISRSIKALAKELDVPIIALSQLSRAVETRGGDKKPMLSDLRESGAIEQDADLVMFLWRPDYYQIDTTEDGDMMDKGHTELIIEKHRNGATGTAKLKFISNQAKFADSDYTQSERKPSLEESFINGSNSPAPIQPNTDFNEPVSDKPF